MDGSGEMAVFTGFVLPIAVMPYGDDPQIAYRLLEADGRFGDPHYTGVDFSRRIVASSFPLDYEGDGSEELLFPYDEGGERDVWGVLRFQVPGVIDAVRSSNINLGKKMTFGDFNGDGLKDVIHIKYEDPCSIAIQMNQGKFFSSLQNIFSQCPGAEQDGIPLFNLEDGVHIMDVNP